MHRISPLPLNAPLPTKISEETSLISNSNEAEELEKFNLYHIIFCRIEPDYSYTQIIYYYILPKLEKLQDSHALGPRLLSLTF